MTILFFGLALVFWGSLALLLHTYAIYPLWLGFLARGCSLPEDRFEWDDEFPEVAVLMAVYNEEKVLEATLTSILASDYPVEKLRVFIGSDGSTDRSDEIVKRFAQSDPRLELVGFGGRNGKIRVVNHLAAEAVTGFRDPDKAIFALCDANVAWSPEMLRRLASHFKRESVGLVGSAVCDPVREHKGIGDEEETYIGQENLVKYREGVLWGCVIGAFGACYTMRTRLFTPVPTHHIVDDFFLTFSCLEQGADAIVDLEAVCHESVSTDIREEFRRKRRIAAGNFQNLRRFWDFIQPWNSDAATTFAFWSHKGLRWFGPFLLAAAMLSCAVLAAMHSFYWLPLTGFAGAVAMAGADAILSKSGGRHVKVFRFARYFLSMNLALLIGFFDFLRGPRSSVWEPTRREMSTPAAPAKSREPEPAMRR